jgi:hypothetical protein
VIAIEMSRKVFEDLIVDNFCECRPPSFPTERVKNVIEVQDEDAKRVYGVVTCPLCVGTVRMTKIRVEKK